MTLDVKAALKQIGEALEDGEVWIPSIREAINAWGVNCGLDARCQTLEGWLRSDIRPAQALIPLLEAEWEKVGRVVDEKPIDTSGEMYHTYGYDHVGVVGATDCYSEQSAGSIPAPAPRLHSSSEILRQATERIVAGCIKSAVDSHGPITTQNIGSAAKRIANQLHALAASSPVGSLRPLVEQQTVQEAERRVLAIRGSNDAPGFDACVKAEIEAIKERQTVESLVRKLEICRRPYPEYGTDLPQPTPFDQGFDSAIGTNIAIIRQHFSSPIWGDEQPKQVSGVEPLLEALSHASHWIGQVEHGDNCFLTTDPSEYDKCFCGKDSVERAIESALSKIETQAPVTLVSGDEKGGGE